MPGGKGILPDHEVKPTKEDVVNGRDAVMAFARRLIREESKQSRKDEKE